MNFVSLRPENLMMRRRDGRATVLAPLQFQNLICGEESADNEENLGSEAR